MGYSRREVRLGGTERNGKVPNGNLDTPRTRPYQGPADPAPFLSQYAEEHLPICLYVYAWIRTISIPYWSFIHSITHEGILVCVAGCRSYFLATSDAQVGFVSGLAWIAALVHTINTTSLLLNYICSFNYLFRLHCAEVCNVL